MVEQTEEEKIGVVMVFLYPQMKHFNHLFSHIYLLSHKNLSFICLICEIRRLRRKWQLLLVGRIYYTHLSTFSSYFLIVNDLQTKHKGEVAFEKLNLLRYLKWNNSLKWIDFIDPLSTSYYLCMISFLVRLYQPSNKCDNFIHDLIFW